MNFRFLAIIADFGFGGLIYFINFKSKNGFGLFYELQK